MIQNKYKEVAPEKTVEEIRKTLSTIGIIPLENTWFHSAEGYYSVRLIIPNTDIGTNGKGTTPLYALASAYAELMERMQNMAPFKLSIQLDEDAFKNENFYFFPDECEISSDELINTKNKWIEIQTNNKIKELENLIKLWGQISYSYKKDSFIGTPIKNIVTNEIIYMPQIMLSKMYMSNGMCAGNTKEEALVQGISEVIERYVNRKIIMEKITPPDIPYDYLKKYPNIIKMIIAIEKKGPFNIMLKDCSLGEKLPVVGAILHNNAEQTYFVKFGSFPNFEIAAERTLTEMMQGQNIKYMKGMTKFISDDNLNNHQNILGILVNGIGNYPLELFHNKPSYDFDPHTFVEYNTNEEFCNYYIRLFKRRNKEIFIRDATCFKLPSYQVIIPNFSEIELFNDIDSINKRYENKKIKELILTLEKLNNEDKKELINKLLKYYHINSSPAKIIGLNKEDIYPWYYKSVGQLVTLLYSQVKDYKNAYNIYFKWLKFNGNKKRSNEEEKKIFAINNYLKMKKDNKSSEYIIEFMKKYYNQDLIEDILRNYEEKSGAFIKAKPVNCFNCEDCQYKDKCNKYNNKKLYIKLKEQMSKNFKR